MSKHSISETYSAVILGATFAGIAASEKAGKNSLVIERSIQAGGEFVNAWNPGTGWDNEPGTNEAKELKKDLIKRGLIDSRGAVHLPPMGPFLFMRIKKKNLNILVNTEILSIDKTDNAFLLTIYNISGISIIKAKKIIDTTTDCASLPREKMPVLKKSINAVLYSHGKNAAVPSMKNEKTVFEFDKFGEELIMKVPVSKKISWTQARKKIHDLAQNYKDEMGPWKVCAVATVFDIIPDVRKLPDNDIIYCISKSYDNPVHAFDAGCRLWSR